MIEITLKLNNYAEAKAVIDRLAGYVVETSAPVETAEQPVLQLAPAAANPKKPKAASPKKESPLQPEKSDAGITSAPLQQETSGIDALLSLATPEPEPEVEPARRTYAEAAKEYEFRAALKGATQTEWVDNLKRLRDETFGGAVQKLKDMTPEQEALFVPLMDKEYV